MSNSLQQEKEELATKVVQSLQHLVGKPATKETIEEIAQACEKYIDAYLEIKGLGSAITAYINGSPM